MNRKKTRRKKEAHGQKYSQIISPKIQKNYKTVSRIPLYQTKPAANPPTIKSEIQK